MLTASFAWAPLQAIRLLRGIQLRGRVVVEIKLGQDRSAPSLASSRALVEVLQDMAQDPAVRAVVLDLRNISAGWAGLQELRRALGRLRKAGKLLVTHLDILTTRELYLASVADRVWLTPSGDVFLQGLGAHLNFYGDALAHLGVKVEMEAAGTFKSFGEPFTRGYPSRANREATGELVGDLQEQLVAAIAKGRGLEPAAVLALMAESPLSAERALEAGLVDGLAYADQAESHLDALLDGKARRLSLRQYARLAGWERRLRRWGRSSRHIAVVHLEGPIVHGAEASGGAGQRIDADRVVPVLDALRESPSTRAVVLYVNSPGGSALASDLIARAVRRLGEHKPVLALFGDVSASGGYYLSAPASEIIAREGTITGSIGVVGGKVTIGPALGRLGVHHERISAGPDSGLFDPWTPLSEAQRARFRVMLGRTYDRFLRIVSAGRKRPIEAVRAVAEGRVWTGRQALERGLVDHIGGLDLALSRARVMASLDEDEGAVRHHRFSPPRFAVFQALLSGRPGALARDLLTAGLEAAGSGAQLAQMVRQHPMEPLALLPYDVDLD